MVRVYHILLLHCNIVNNRYHRDSWILSTFVPSKSFDQLLNISPTNQLYKETFRSEFSYNELWFTDKNFKPLEIENRISLTLVINAGFPNWDRLVGGQFGQNGQKLHKNDKIGIFGSKHWGGDKPIFRVVAGGIPPSPSSPLGETLYGRGI